MTDLDPSNGGLAGLLGATIAATTLWAGRLLLKKMGLDGTTASEANAQAQKDMLDWQREQLKDEVARREKAESQAQSYLEKMNELAGQMTRMELQNNHLQSQLTHVLEQNEMLRLQVTNLTETVERLQQTLAHGAQTA